MLREVQKNMFSKTATSQNKLLNKINIGNISTEKDRDID